VGIAEIKASWETELASINAAIAAFTSTGIVEYQVGGRVVKRGDIKTLYARKEKLEALIIDEEIGTTRALASWPGR
jgi:hypothetical protein